MYQKLLRKTVPAITKNQPFASGKYYYTTGNCLCKLATTSTCPKGTILSISGDKTAILQLLRVRPSITGSFVLVNQVQRFVFALSQLDQGGVFLIRSPEFASRGRSGESPGLYLPLQLLRFLPAGGITRSSLFLLAPMRLVFW